MDQEISLLIENPYNPGEFASFVTSTSATITDIASLISDPVNGISIGDNNFLEKSQFGATLGESGIDNFSRIRLEIFNLEAFTLSDEEEKKKKEEEAAKKKFAHPTFNFISKGLNIQGICTNDQCQAHNKKVFCKWGITSFDAFNGPQPTCPVCGNKITPTLVVLNQCKYKNEGSYTSKDDPDNVQTLEDEGFEIVKNSPETFPVELNGDLIWSEFRIIVESL